MFWAPTHHWAADMYHFCNAQMIVVRALFLCAVFWWAHLLNGQEAISMQFVIWSHLKMPLTGSFPQGCLLWGGQKATSLLREAGAVGHGYSLMYLLLYWPWQHIAFTSRISAAWSIHVSVPSSSSPMPPTSLKETQGSCQKCWAKLCLSKMWDFGPRFLTLGNY